MTDQLLRELITEIKGLRSDLTRVNVDTLTPKEALRIIGVNNLGYLKYFFEQGLIDRRKGGKSFLYFKSECEALAQQIKNKSVVVPPVRAIY